MYEMKPEYYIGIDMIDEEHKQLFLYADEAYELLHDEYTPDKYDRIDIILEKLRDYTVKHFADEEQYMESINYKKLFTQKIQHQEFIHKIDEFMEHHNDEVEDQDEQIMGILTYLTEWLPRRSHAGPLRSRPCAGRVSGRQRDGTQRALSRADLASRPCGCNGNPRARLWPGS